MAAPGGIILTERKLSPQAQAVLNAYIQGLATKRLSRLAAALRAAADQVGEWGSAEELRAIADELGSNNV